METNRHWNTPIFPTRHLPIHRQYPRSILVHYLPPLPLYSTGPECEPGQTFPSPCDSCAFAEGGAANLEPYNRLRSEICALSGVPFFCHHGFDWKDPLNHRIVKGRQVGSGGRAQICQGWKAAVVRSAGIPRGSSPEAKLGRLVRKAKGQAALQAIEEAVAADPNDKPELYSRLKRILKHLRKPFSMREKVSLPR